MNTVLAIDHDAKACEVYRANVPGATVVCGEVRDLIGDLPAADVILGGPPCQPYSSAGKRAGANDTRDCVPDFCAAVEKVRPRMFLMEEVDAFATDAKFQPVLQRTVSRLTRAGYDVQLKVLDAVNFGVPQFRKRAWLWGVRTDLGEVIARRKWPTPTHAWPWPEPGCMFGASLLPAVVVGEALELDGWVDRYGRLRNCSSDGRSLGHCAIRRPRQTGAREIAGLDEPSCSLSATRTDEHYLIQSPADPASAVQEYRWSDAMREKHPPASPASPAPTVQAKWYKGGAEGLLSVDGRSWESRHPVPGEDEPMVTLRGRSPRDGGRCTEGVVRHRDSIRRLTPAECARLQSMPDDFVWPESVKKTHQYRIIGNGQASLMTHHLSLAFELADPQSQTVISVFCGGGVGCVGWHHRFWEYQA